MAKCKRLKVLSFAKFQAVLSALLGFFAGILYSFGGLILDILVSANMLASTSTLGLSLGTMFAFGALLGMPIMFGIVGFFLGILEALTFNLFAMFFGGINVDFKH
ncbi:hypothetical protein [Pseudoalteromonas sp.]|uniref:hypothetical protein n=1 Tax=Pseudoalteromonas sp. TaxID=53249 RepID=UPI003569EF5A